MTSYLKGEGGGGGLVNFSIGNNSIIDNEGGGGVKKAYFEMTSFVNGPLSR